MGNHHVPPARATSAAEFDARSRELRAAHRARHIPRYHSLILHWMGRWLRRPKRPPIEPLPDIFPGQVAISFAGHATVLIRYTDRTILCDPMLGRWVKGVKRAVAPGLSAGELAGVQLILISHAHADHLHRPTLAQLPRSATIIVPPRTAQQVSDLGFARVVEMRSGQSIQDHGVDVATASVRHGDQAENQALSYVIRGPGPSVYFCGDSGYHPGFADVGARYHPDIAILPIGGYLPLSFRDRHMSPLDALYALEDLGARVMIPIHHGAFALSYEQLREPGRWLAQLVHDRGLDDFVIALDPGESRVFVPPRTDRAETALRTSGVAGAARKNARLSGEPLALPAVPASARIGLAPRPRVPPAPGPDREVSLPGIVIDFDAAGVSEPVVVPG